MFRRCFQVALFFLPLTVFSQEQSQQPAWYARSFPCGSREATEQFLLTARIVKVKDLGTGVTRPRKVALDDGKLQHNAIFKDIDERKMGVTFVEGKPEYDFKDSWKFEVAAYELDKLLGLNTVPVTVEREVDGKQGSLQIWIDDCMSDGDRRKKKLDSPDKTAWNCQLHRINLFDNLIFNIDRNVGNLLISPEWKIYMIDHTRAFKTTPELRKPQDLVAFSASLIAALGKLDNETASARCGKYLTSAEIGSLLKRRDLILKRYRTLRAEKGVKILYP